jgi:hypothetical protein
MIQYKNWNCNVLFHTYQENGNTAIQLVDARDGQPIATASVNLSTPLAQDEVYIKNYSENEGVLEALVEGGILSPPISYSQTGFVTVPRCKILVPIFVEELEEDNENDMGAVTEHEETDVCNVYWVAYGPDFTVYEFDVYGYLKIDDDYTTDCFQVIMENDGTTSVYTRFDEDYDIGDEVTHLFDLAKLVEQIAAETPKGDHTEAYLEHLKEAEEAEKEWYTVRVTIDGESFIDGIKGKDREDALKNAKDNWTTASNIEVSEKPTLEMEKEHEEA